MAVMLNKELVNIRVLFCFIIVLISVAGCSGKEISGTYKGENENWEIQDVVSVKGEVRKHEITVIPKNGYSEDEIPNIVVTLEDVIETKTIAKKTDEGVYKARDANAINFDKKGEIDVEVIIFATDEEQEFIRLSKVD
jgi:hypothetical protein